MQPRQILRNHLNSHAPKGPANRKRSGNSSPRLRKSGVRRPPAPDAGAAAPRPGTSGDQPAPGSPRCSPTRQPLLNGTESWSHPLSVRARRLRLWHSAPDQLCEPHCFSQRRTLRAKRAVACLLWMSSQPRTVIERAVIQFGGARTAAGPIHPSRADKTYLVTQTRRCLYRPQF
jgi:hypothetical protein